METGAVVAVAVTLFIALFAVLVCIFATVSSVSGNKQTNDDDSEA